MKALTLAVVCLTLAAAACGGDDGPQSAGPVTTVREDARPAAPPARPTSSPGSERVGFIGVPPVGATPSAPERGELVLHWHGNTAHAKPHPSRDSPLFRVWVYADGRIIWDHDFQAAEGRFAQWRIPGVNPGFLEQRLTPEGVERLRLEVVGLLAPSRSLLETLPADYDPGPMPYGRLRLFVQRDYGSCCGLVDVREGDRLVRLQWLRMEAEQGSTSFHEELDRLRKDWAFEGTIATPDQLSGLRRVDALLTDPVSVLPSSAWADRQIRAYVPSQFAICVTTTPPTDLSNLLSLLPARAEELLRDKSWTRSESDVVTNTREDQRMRVMGSWVEYCSKAPTEEAREVAEALSGLDRHTRGDGEYSQAYLVAEGVKDWEVTSIRFEPYFPHGAFPSHAR
jgi:hypothetical protein